MPSNLLAVVRWDIEFFITKSEFLDYFTRVWTMFIDACFSGKSPKFGNGALVNIFVGGYLCSGIPFNLDSIIRLRKSLELDVGIKFKFKIYVIIRN